MEAAMARVETPACPGCGMKAQVFVPFEELRALRTKTIPPRKAAPSLTPGDLRQVVTGWCPTCVQAREVADLLAEIRRIPALVLV
jgi:hypothetical protein